MRDDHYRKRCFAAAVIAWCWIAMILIAILCSSMASGAELSIGQSVQGAVCRVYNEYRGSSSVGSGTLIDKRADGQEGLVLTCAHLFREGTGRIIVEFSNGKRHLANLIDVDHQADLAALAIANPSAQSVVVAEASLAQGKFHACGYGPQGIYRCAVGSVTGQAASTGQMSLMIDDPVRSGDSGGGVFDQQGQLVAVVWGEAQGVTYASCGRPLKSFLGRVLGKRQSVVYRCPGGVCPVPKVPAQEEHSILVDPRFQKLQQQINQLRQEKQDRGNYLTGQDLQAYALSRDLQHLEAAGNDRHSNLLTKIAQIANMPAGQAAIGTLGISSPMGWGLLAATSVGGWLLGRIGTRVMSGAGGRRRRPFQKPRRDIGGS